MDENKVVGLYIRISGEKQAKEDNPIEVQQVKGTQIAQGMFGEDVVIKLYIDEGISAEGTNGRTGLNNMLRDVENGALDAVITHNLSRLSRSHSDSLKVIEDIQKARVRFITMKED